MAKKKDNFGSTALAVKEDQPLAIPQAPSEIAKYAGEGTEYLKGANELSIVATVQAMSGMERKEQFGEGAIILAPDDLLLCGARQSFTGSVVHSHKSWGQWRDGNDSSTPYPIVMETHDENSPLARKCQQIGYTEPYTDKPEMTYRFFEQLDFVLLLDQNEDVAAGTIAFLRYKSGGYKTGRNLRKLLARLGEKGWPIYGSTIRFTSTPLTNKNGKTNWYPVASLVATLDGPAIEANRKVWESIDKAYKARTLTTKQADVPPDGVDPETGEVIEQE